MKTIKEELQNSFQQPEKWVFLFGNGFNRHAYAPDFSWNSILNRLPSILRGVVSNNAICNCAKGVDSPIEVFSILCSKLWKPNSIGSKSPNGVDIATKAFIDVLKDLMHWSPQQYFADLRSRLVKLNIPILTTNFDNNIEGKYKRRYLSLDYDPLSNTYNTSSRKGYSRYYPWNSYYSENVLNSADDGFAVWHIHGDINLPSSIRLGYSEYGGAITNAHKLVHNIDQPNRKRLYAEPVSPLWAGYNTWLQLFFKRAICVAGLGIGQEELFLRLLIIERYKFLQTQNINLPSSIYLCKNNEISTSQRVFLKNFGFKIMEFDDYYDFYSLFPF